MKPKRKIPPEFALDITPEPPEDAKMTGRKGGIKKAGKDMSTTRPSGGERRKGKS